MKMAGQFPMCVHEVAGESAVYHPHGEGIGLNLNTVLKDNVECWLKAINGINPYLAIPTCMERCIF
jgi:hypothetical protein